MYDWEIRQYVADKKVLTVNDFYSTIFIQENIMWQIFAFFFLHAILHVRKQDKYTHLTSELTWWDSLAFQPSTNRLIPFKVYALWEEVSIKVC